MAQVVQITALKVALSNSTSLMVLDEAPEILENKGFCKMWGANHAMGRKTGISLLTLSQTYADIKNCYAGEKILKNIRYLLVGRITTEEAINLKEVRNYPKMVFDNASSSFDKKKAGYTSWLLEMGGKFWRLKHIASNLNLALLANNREEIQAREMFMRKAKNDWVGVKDYARSR